MRNIKTSTRLIVEDDHVGDRFVMLRVTNPDGQRKSIAYHYDNVHGRWIRSYDAAPVNDNLSNLFDMLIAAHNMALPAVEENLHDREN